jgi:hypothetical protein
MALRGRIGAFVTHSRHDPRETTAKARRAFLSRFEREVDPDGVLPVAERLRRAESARRAYFARLALRSVRARAKSRGRGNGDAAAGIQGVLTTPNPAPENDIARPGAGRADRGS